MAMTLEELKTMLEAEDLDVLQAGDEIFCAFKTRTFRDSGDRNVVRLAFKLLENGEYFRLCVPLQMTATGPYLDAALRACMSFQWRTKLVRFEYDESDGEIRPSIELPLQDNRLTPRQLRRCFWTILRELEDFHAPFRRALEEGVVQFDQGPSAAEQRLVLEHILRQLEAGGGSEEEVKTLKAVLARLEEPPTEI